MIAADQMFQALRAGGIGLFAGVPDSLLADFCACVEANSQPDEHVITANEGNAIALASGYHLATGRIAGVYLQNSGLGNAINPLTSLTDAQVYRIPLLLIIGWRGEPGVPDEPQHIKQGRITPAQLELLEIPYHVLGAESDANAVLAEAMRTLRLTQAPVALLVRKNTFLPYARNQRETWKNTLKREDALRCLLDLCGDALLIATTGKTSRELFELRVERGESQRDFLTVGAMGHTASIALGVALGQPQRRVICLDGDGSALMHMGALPIIGSQKPPNLLHVLLNNAAHESVGGQPTVANRIDFETLAKACGYPGYAQVADVEALRAIWPQLTGQPGPTLLEVRIAIGSRADLGRPTSTPEQNKQAFMQWAAR